MKKLELTVTRQNNVETVRYDLDAGDVYDDRVAEKVTLFGNIVPFRYSDEDGRRSIISYIHEDTNLETMIKKTLSKREVLGIMSGLSSALEIGAQGIPVSYLVKDLNHIYVNVNTLSVKCILVPVKQEVMPLAEIPALFRLLISKMKFSDEDKDNYVAKLLTLINSDDFSISKYKELVNEQLEKIGLFISKENGVVNIAENTSVGAQNSDVKVNRLGVMNNMQTAVRLHQPQMQMNQPMMPQGQMQMNQPGQQPMMPQGQVQMNQPRPQGQMPQGQMQMNQPGQQPMMPQGQAQMNQPRPQVQMPQGQVQMNQPRPQPMMPQGQAQMNQPRPQVQMPQGQVQMNQLGPQSQMPTGNIMINSVKPVYDEASSGMPVKSVKADVIVTQGNVAQGSLVGQLGTRPVPHIVRKNTGEVINISKPQFSIGKSKTKADYAVENNAAISRVHCTIIQRDGVNYIKDNNSTNHTYINGVELQPGKEVLLKNKTVIQMGDEEFTFLLRKGE